jgi:hypothetical protein
MTSPLTQKNSFNKKELLEMAKRILAKQKLQKRKTIFADALSDAPPPYLPSPRKRKPEVGGRPLGWGRGLDLK